jgi:hypothetical protein
MPANTVWGLEWLNANSQRSYPLSSVASKEDTTETFKIPDSLLLSLYLPVSYAYNIESQNFFVSDITVLATGISLSVSYWDGSDATTVATSIMPFDGHTEYKSYLLVGRDAFEDSIGRVVFGKLEELKNLPAGRYLFSYEGGALDTDCIRPNIRGVSSITLVNGSDRTEKIYGDIEIVAGTNMQISYQAAVEDGPAVLTFNAISGEGLSNDCACAQDDTISPCIRTINGIPPSPAGDFSIITDDCYSVEGQTNGIKITDTCASPCCGCQELEAVTRDLVRFGDAGLTLENYLNRLEGSVNRMNITVLGSRLGDGGCAT